MVRMKGTGVNDTVKLLAEGLAFPEGPAFDPEGNLWCTELQAGNLVLWSNDSFERYPVGGAPNGLAFGKGSQGWVCDAQRNAVGLYDPATDAWQVLGGTLEGRPLNMPNDLAFDADGNLVFTCPGGSDEEPVGYVCCLRPGGELTKIGDGMYFPNGLAFMDGGRALVVAETNRQRLWRGEWDASAARWIDPQPWADVGGPAGPDGMALGEDGRMYVAVYGSGQIKAVDAAGQVVQTYDLPGKNPTNCAFDPSGELGLVVTEAELGHLLSLPDLGPGIALFTG